MSVPVLFLYLLNFVLFITMPIYFFRKDGAFNVKWWLTSLPLGLCPAALAVAWAAKLVPYLPGSWVGPSELVAVGLSAASLCLLFYTLGTHRVPLSLWHQSNDAPRYIVTEGAYRRIRHPFYTSYLLAFAGAVVLFPHWMTITLAIYACVVLNVTAAREERRLATSEYGAQYRQYMARTGRFVPGLRRCSAP
ncbi:methyltransferase family protein [Mycobacterium marinum]|uniref:methyltransferase family protein n=1 Tax=Mycobacterium marinum TaxID=1781 RepID=UPI003564EE03